MYSILFFVAWLIAAFTFERFIVVRYPLKRSKLCTVRRTKIIIGCIAVTAFIIQIVGLLPTGVVAKSSGASAHRENTSRSWPSQSIDANNRLLVYYEVIRILNMLETGITLVIPPVLIVIMNALIIRSLFQFNQTFKTGEMNKHLTSSSSKKTRRSNELIIKQLVDADAIAIKSQSDDMQLNMDEIETDVIVHLPSARQDASNRLQQDEEAVTSLINDDVDHQTQQQQRRNKSCFINFNKLN